ncbi:MAG: hypothetical protein R3301_09350 [Saprospiraceae bacterium]|nr:hypothetical protein [Saprospiraceae bacterium]
MNRHVLFAFIAALLLNFFGGWVVWGIALMDLYQSNSTEAVLALQKEEMEWVSMIFAQIGWAALLVWVLVKTGSNTARKGAMTAAILGGLISFSMDLFFHASMDWYANVYIIVIDIVVNIVFAALVGALVGWILGKGSTAAA